MAIMPAPYITPPEPKRQPHSEWFPCFSGVGKQIVTPVHKGFYLCREERWILKLHKKTMRLMWRYWSGENWYYGVTAKSDENDDWFVYTCPNANFKPEDNNRPIHRDLWNWEWCGTTKNPYEVA